MSDALIPDPVASDRQYNRFYHFDIEGLEDTELIDELYALRPLLWGRSPNHWLRERVRMLETELIKRRGHIRDELRGRLKPKPAEGVTL